MFFVLSILVRPCSRLTPAFSRDHAPRHRALDVGIGGARRTPGDVRRSFKERERFKGLEGKG